MDLSWDNYNINNISENLNIYTTSKGNQEKFHKDGRWYKINHMGYEGRAEWAVSEFLKCTTLTNNEFVTYQQKVENGRNACVSENFLREGERLISFYRIFVQNAWDFEKYLTAQPSIKDKVKLLINIIGKFTNVDVTDYLRKTFTLDAFVYNEDRHLNNLALIYNEKGEFKTSPIFDNGLSLLADTGMYMEGTPVISNLRRIKSKPFGVYFEDQMNVLGKGFEIKESELIKFIEKNKSELGRIYDIIKYSMQTYEDLLI